MKDPKEEALCALTDLPSPNGLLERLELLGGPSLAFKVRATGRSRVSLLPAYYVRR